MRGQSLARRPWTNEMVARLTQLWGQHVETREIATVLNLPLRMVGGKAYRLGLHRQRHLQAVAVSYAYAVRPRFAAPPTREAAPAVPLPRVLACIWPQWQTGNRPTHEYCGAAVLEDHVYCSAHCKRAFVAAPPDAAMDELMGLAAG